MSKACRIAGLAVIAASFAQPAVAQEPERIERGNLIIEGIPDIPADVRERLRQYTNTRGAGFVDWAPDGGVLISTRFGETSQAHMVATPLGARQQLTFFDERIGVGDVQPGGATFLFTRDVGGDEFFQGFVFDLANGSSVQISEPGTRNGSVGWSDDGDQIMWNSTTAEDPNYDIYIADAADPLATRRVAFEAEGLTYPIQVTADGATMLMGRYFSPVKSELYLLDMASGEMTEILPELEVSLSAIHLTSDGATVYAATDHESEFDRVVAIDVATNAITVLTPEPAGDVQGADISPDEATMVYAVNAGGLSTVHILDLASGETRPGPDLPTGLAGGFEFNADGTQVGFTFNSYDSPSDVWSFTMADMALTRWTQSEVGGLDSSTFIEPELVVYAQKDGFDIPAFVYKPEGEGPHPVIVSIHGGPEAQYRPGFSSTFQYWLNELGAAVIAPNVRGSAGYGKTYVALDNGFDRKKSVEDIGSLLDWIAEQPDLDSDRVVVYGGSYGGYMVLASMVDYGDRLAGGVNIVGISSFVTFLENTKGYRRDLRRQEYGDERDPEMRAFMEEIAPLNNADQITKPLFVIQGLNDPRVPASEAEQILDAVRGNGAKVWYLAAKDEGHGFRKKSNRDYQREAETLFLRDVLNLD